MVTVSIILQNIREDLVVNLLTSRYFLGVNAPRAHADNGAPLPSARRVSVVFAEARDSPSDNYTLLLMQWGQFVDHDLTHTPISRGKFSDTWLTNSGKYRIFIRQQSFYFNFNGLINAGQSGFGISCCRNGRPIDPSLRHPDCFAIEIPINDHVFSRFGERCMEFVRSLPAPRPECNFGPREQVM